MSGPMAVTKDMLIAALEDLLSHRSDDEDDAVWVNEKYEETTYTDLERQYFLTPHEIAEGRARLLLRKLGR